MEHLLSTPSWTPSARLEPERLVGSPNYGVSHPGHVTSNPPPSLAEPGQTSELLQPGSTAPTAPNTVMLIVSERKMERGRA
ncbi:hypothetical protein CgunFtcFv8_020568 [Champsocephalus gunnari]|uniref:Uncharacterized protein n=1 Tax=Champsocephalus gunnari TaxID=52237 RepID=A0AAN8IE45_CHAGU|nr:hypothetical protein CgunFtcFv8_020568 [Champsocephalus gunnari]